MLQNVLKPVLAALAVGAALAAPAPAEAVELPGRPAEAGQAADWGVRYGPYATIRRANEVANYYRRLGYNARVIPIHNLGGYFVYVS